MSGHEREPMLRSAEKTNLDQDPDFRWRGDSVTRIENLSDIVFALSLSLLAVAGPPATFGDLVAIFHGAFGFAFGFAILLLIWNYHYLYFRRYGLSDQRTVFLNALLLFVVLLFVYPLRFLSDFAVTLVGAFATRDFSGVGAMVGGLEHGAQLLIIYSFGYAAVFLIVAALYSHAASKAGMLDLNDTEMRLTRRSRAAALVQAGVALFVAALAAFTPIGPWAGPFYFLIGPAAAIVGRRYRKA